jgi:hypothetical protein
MSALSSIRSLMTMIHPTFRGTAVMWQELARLNRQELAALLQQQPILLHFSL